LLIPGVPPDWQQKPHGEERLRHGPADLPAMDGRLRPLRILGADPLDTDAAAVQRDIKPQAVGWWVLAGLAALAGLAVIGQAIARQSATERADHRALSALGIGFRELVLVAMVRAVAIGAAGAATPAELVNFGEAVNFPLLFGVMLSLFGAATMVHLLLVSVARRRRDTGLLKVLGLVRHQVAAAVCWQATTITVIGIVAGVPLGVAGGQFVWRAFATNFGVVPVAVVQPLPLVALAGAVLAAANVLAVVPALLAARSRPGPLIRAE